MPQYLIMKRNGFKLGAQNQTQYTKKEILIYNKI